MGPCSVCRVTAFLIDYGASTRRTHPTPAGSTGRSVTCRPGCSACVTGSPRTTAIYTAVDRRRIMAHQRRSNPDDDRRLRACRELAGRGALTAIGRLGDEGRGLTSHDGVLLCVDSKPTRSSTLGHLDRAGQQDSKRTPGSPRRGSAFHNGSIYCRARLPTSVTSCGGSTRTTSVIRRGTLGRSATSRPGCPPRKGSYRTKARYWPWATASSGASTRTTPAPAPAITGPGDHFPSGLQGALAGSHRTKGCCSASCSMRDLWNINPANPSDDSGDYGLVGNLPSSVGTPGEGLRPWTAICSAPALATAPRPICGASTLQAQVRRDRRVRAGRPLAGRPDRPRRPSGARGGISIGLSALGIENLSELTDAVASLREGDSEMVLVDTSQPRIDLPNRELLAAGEVVEIEATGIHTLEIDGNEVNLGGGGATWFWVQSLQEVQERPPAATPPTSVNVRHRSRWISRSERWQRSRGSSASPSGRTWPCHRTAAG